MPTNEPQLIDSGLLASVGIIAFFTGRQGGVSHPPFDSLNFGFGIGDHETAVSENIQRLEQQTGLTSRPHQTKQVHGTAHLNCSGPGIVHDYQADIIVSQTPGTAVAVRTADCLPILLADPQAGVIAAVHAGWRGTAQRVVVYAIEAMKGLGADPEHIYASIGPSIGLCCFEICEETANALATSVSNGETAISRNGKPHADLALINNMQLLECNVEPNRIENLQLCTSCHPNRFYSYRRERGITGRHLAVVALPASI